MSEEAWLLRVLERNRVEFLGRGREAREAAAEEASRKRAMEPEVYGSPVTPEQHEALLAWLAPEGDMDALGEL